MVNVPSIFHTKSKGQNPKTRIRIYFIGDSVNCWDDADVQANGTLLKLNVSDTDSNGRINITSSPVTVTEYYMPNTNAEIGRCVSNTLSLTLINDDGALNNFTFGRCKVYIDLYANNTWNACAMGVYIIDIPVRRLVANISATAYDQMQLLDADASDWFSSLSWANGLDSWDIFSALCTELGLHIASGTTSAVMCLPYTYNTQPFSADNMTYRDILSHLAQANGCVAVFDRDGSMQLVPLFNSATTSYGYTSAGGYFEFDRAEYTVAAIDGCSVKSSNDDIGVETAGSNMYLIAENSFLNALPTTDDAQDACDALATFFGSASFSYTPASFRTVGDWSLCAGDCISIDFKGWSGVIPIMQQTLRWQGSSVETTISCTGDATLPQVPNRVVRQQLQTAHSIHELRVTAEELLSRISASDANYSEILQLFDSITATVADIDNSLTTVISSNDQLWTFAQTIRGDLDDEVSERETYIRFTNEPAIILGVNTGDEIKLKIVNDVIYFFNGSDDSTDLSNAFGFFNSEGLQTGWVKAEQRFQIGTDATDNWLWHKTSKGNLALDLI